MHGCEGGIAFGFAHIRPQVGMSGLIIREAERRGMVKVEARAVELVDVLW